MLDVLRDVPLHDGGRYRILWHVEKWSEEAVEYGRKKCESMGLTHIVSPHGDNAFGLLPIDKGISSALLRALVCPPEEEAEVVGNMLLNEGIQRLEDLTMIATVLTNQTAANAWGNTNAYLGVGDSSTAEAATQTDLQAATNHFYKVMNATYPSRASQTVTFQADFVTAEANFAWAEWTISAGATGVSGGGFTTGTTNLNRKVASLGTKSTGTWTLSATITFS